MERSGGCWHRLRGMSSDAGAWGEFLFSILMFSWVLNIAFGDGIIATWGALSGLIALMGKGVVLTWLSTAAFAPVFGIALGWATVRVLTTTYILISWLWLLFETIIVGNIGRPAMWTCVVGALACLNSGMRLADSVMNKDGR